MHNLNSIRRSATVMSMIAIFSTLYFARDLFMPIAAAVLIALTFSPVVRALRRFGIPAPVTAFILISTSGAFVAVIVFVLSGPISELISNGPQIGAALRQKLAGALEALRIVQEVGKQVDSLGGEGARVPTVAIEQPGFLSLAAGTTASILSLMTVALVLAFFLLASGDLFYIKLVESVPTFSDKRKAVGIVRDIERQMSLYLLTVTAINAALGLCIGIAMYAVEMPNPLLWGVVGFALNFIPFIGALAGAAAVAAIGILTFDTTFAGLMPAMVYLALTTIEGQFITPSIVGRRLALNTVSVLLAVVCWSWLWSIPGTLMSVPLLVLLKVIADNTTGMQTLGNFLGTHLPASVA